MSFNGRLVLEILRNLDYPRLKAGFLNPIETLIKTVLSQRTTTRNMLLAYENLRRRGLTDLAQLAYAEERVVANAIKIAGLYVQRARRLKLIAKIVLEVYKGDLNNVLSMPLEKARKALLSLPGVGYKTADILLLFCAGKPVFPVDTHISRISVRWGLARQGAEYEDIRRSLENFYPRDPQSYLDAHLGMISLGRRYCKTRKVLCNVCLLGDVCPYSLSKTNHIL